MQDQDQERDGGEMGGWWGTVQKVNTIDLELTIDPAPPPRGNFRDYDFLIPYGM